MTYLTNQRTVVPEAGTEFNGKKIKLDTSSGAPTQIRMLVGNRNDPKERLELLRKYYPDAISLNENDALKEIAKKRGFGEDNFIYTVTDDDGNEVQTLYNNQTLDIQDVSSYGRTIAENIGGSLGAIVATVGGQLGPQAATPEEIFTVPIAIGLGSEMAGQAYDNAMNILVNLSGKELVSRGKLSKQIVDAFSNIGIEASGIRSVDALTKALKDVGLTKFVQPLVGIGKQSKEKAKTLAKQAASLGLKIPTLGLLTQNPTVQFLEKVMIQSPVGVKQFVNKIEEFNTGVGNAVKTISGKYGKGVTEKEQIGKIIFKGTEDYKQRYTEIANKLYGEVDQLFPNKVNIKNVKELATELQTKLDEGNIPAAIKPTLTETLRLIKAAETNQGLKIGVLHSNRSDILKLAREYKASGTKDTLAVNTLRDLASAISKDMDAGIEAFGGKEAVKKYKEASRFVANKKEDFVNYLDDILAKEKDADKIFNFAFGSVKDGGTKINTILKNLTEDERGDVASSMILRLGLKNPSGEVLDESFNPRTFITNWSKISPTAKDAIFGKGGNRKNLDDLSNVLKSYLKGERYTNFSNTGNSVMTAVLMTPVLTGSMMTFGAKGVASGALMTAPYLASKLFTSESFMKSIIEGAPKVYTKPSSLGTWAGRLLDDARKESERKNDTTILDAVEFYLHDLLSSEPVEPEDVSEVDTSVPSAMAQADVPKETPQQPVGNVQVTQPNINITPPTTQAPPPQMMASLPDQKSVGGGGITSVGKKEQFGGLFPTDDLGKLIASRKA
tara:strand:- start:10430 stop:12784 length:2355 start_codon:yes stop_codon:yes gene_type:complete